MRTMHSVSCLILLAASLAACAPAATPAPQAAPAPTQPPPAVAQPTQPLAPTAAALNPPSAGGVVIAPTRSATGTPAPGQVISGRSQPAWQRVDAANPPPARDDHTLTLDAANQKLVLFGGQDGTTSLGDTWIFDLKLGTWRPVKTSIAPLARHGHAAAYDARLKRILIFAGQAAGFFNDVWAFDAAKETWQKLETQGGAPAPRYGTSAVVDARTNQLIITHGFAAGRFDDTFALDLASGTWTQLKPVDAPPLKRCLHESVYDARTDRMILFGGCSSGFGPCPQGDLWSLNVSAAAWTEILPAGIKPSPRSNPSLVDDESGHLILFGGLTRDGPAGDVWSLDIASGEWTAIAVVGDAPVARASHDSVWNTVTGQMIVFGGKGQSGALNDMWSLVP